MDSQKRRFPPFLIYLIFIAALIIGAIVISRTANRSTQVSYSDYIKDLEDGNIKKAEIQQNNEVPTGVVYYTTSEAEKASVKAAPVPNVSEERDRLMAAGISVVINDVPGEDIFLGTILPILIIGLLMFVMIIFMNGRANSAGAGVAGNFTKSRAQISDPKKNQIRFKDVAGLLEEKEELEEVVDFLRDPKKYLNMGARIPKGILLVGPPGTGKTLLAKAIAGEAGVPFVTISGSDFVELFVGVGASRVRDLFNTAKQNAPCIIFIDEIDAVARIRGSGLGGGHDEREQTLNQILVEMDGFTVNQGIIVMAATNRADILDPAILRPGRFDRKVAVGKPDVKGREEILRVHARKKKIGEDVDFKKIAKTTAGFTGADLENLLNEAAIGAAKRNADYITEHDVELAFVKVGIGQEKKSKVISEKEKKITAYHEMGHAILFETFPDVGSVHTVSIIPTGLGAAGYTMPLPENDEMFYTKSRMLQEISVFMGGRIAEEMVFGDITTGASQDIKEATELARKMVMKYGMSDKIGFINYEQSQEEVFMGRDLGHMKTYGTEVVNEIESEVKRIMRECYDEASRILKEKEDVLHRGARLLIEKEKLNQDEFRAVYYGSDERQIEDRESNPDA